ncbi:sodium-dependent dopamine transporter-like [Amblyomma americanum]
MALQARIRRFSFDAEFMLGRRPNIYWRTCWVILCPFALAFACPHKIRTIKTPVFFNVTIPDQYQALAWIIGCAGLLQIPIGAFSSIIENIRFPLRAFQPEYLWEPNTVNRVNAYFEEIEDRDIGVGQEFSGAVAPGILYDATEVLDISMDQDEPLAFRPFMG